MDSKIDDVILTRQGAAGESPTAPSLDLARPELFDRAWGSHFAKRKEKMKQVAVVIDLPTGQSVGVVRMPLWYLLHKGMIPDRISGYAQEHVRLLSAGDPELAQQQVMSSYIANEKGEQVTWDDLLDEIWIRCVVAPKFGRGIDVNVTLNDDGEPWLIDHSEGFMRSVRPVAEGDKDLVWNVKDVEMIDKIFVYQFCQGVDESVESFLRTTSAALGAVADGLGLPVQAE